MNWNVFLRGLAVAAIGGAATGAVHAMTGTPASSTGAPTINANTGKVAAAGAVVTVLAYLLQSPMTQPSVPVSPIIPPASN